MVYPKGKKAFEKLRKNIIKEYRDKGYSLKEAKTIAYATAVSRGFYKRVQHRRK